jgi:hypothetical protein
MAWFHDYLTGNVIGDRLTYSLQGLPIQTDNLQVGADVRIPAAIPESMTA